MLTFEWNVFNFNIFLIRTYGILFTAIIIYIQIGYSISKPKSDNSKLICAPIWFESTNNSYCQVLPLRQLKKNIRDLLVTEQIPLVPKLESHNLSDIKLIPIDNLRQACVHQN